MAKIAVIGSGISGMGAAWLLHPHHDVTLFEKASRVGGHSRTVTVNHGGKIIPVDTGFIVFNRPNYPNLSALFRHLDVPVHKSDMTFAATIAGGRLEWGAESLNSVFGQRRNIVSPRFHKLVRDVLKFNAEAVDAVDRYPDCTIAELADKLGLGDWFCQYYLLPMAGAIWSCPPCEIKNYPAHTLVRFFANHHLLSTDGQHQWYTVTGGSQEYVKRLIAPLLGRIRTSCGAVAVTRRGGAVQIADSSGHTERFDKVVFASHGDETLELLRDATDEERNVLSAFRFQPNRAVLHKDISVMPRRRRCWASWVYASDGAQNEPAIGVSYWMNRLQGIADTHPLFVSLNPVQPIADEHVFDTHEFSHPIFDASAITAQAAVQRLQGTANTFYCGAWLRHGFHEDGLHSAVTVAERMGIRAPWSAVSAEYTAPAVRLRPQKVA